MVADTKNLLEKIQCEVVCMCGKQKISFESGAAALSQMANHKVISITAENNTVILNIDENAIIPNDLNEDWVKEHEERYGEKISFF